MGNCTAKSKRQDEGLRWLTKYSAQIVMHQFQPMSNFAVTAEHLYEMDCSYTILSLFGRLRWR